MFVAFGPAVSDLARPINKKDLTMKHRLFRVLLVVLTALSLGPPVRAAAAERPNVVLIMVDDFGAECVGVYGGTSYQTPHMDALAAGGIQFTNAYTPPLCTPTRVQLMSGQYPFRNGWSVGIWSKDQPGQVVDPRTLPLGAMMRGAGYKTAVAGKWQLARFEDHPDHAAQCGFDAHCLWTWRYQTTGKEKPSRYWNPAVWKAGRLLGGTEGEFGPDLYCDALIEFMRTHRDEPFFLYYPMTLVHLPFVQPPGSDAEGDAVRFAAMVEYADGLIGRLVAALDELGLREKTVVLVTGDNGTPREVTSQCNGQAIQGGKGQMTEAGARVPLIANWPGTAPHGAVFDDLVDTSDILPTLAELSGAELPADRVIDGRGFARRLHGEAGNPRQWVYVELKDDWFLRDKKYRLDGDGMLCDMSDRYGARRLTEPLVDEARAAKERLESALRELRGGLDR